MLRRIAPAVCALAVLTGPSAADAAGWAPDVERYTGTLTEVQSNSRGFLGLRGTDSWTRHRTVTIQLRPDGVLWADHDAEGRVEPPLKLTRGGTVEHSSPRRSPAWMRVTARDDTTQLHGTLDFLVTHLPEGGIQVKRVNTSYRREPKRWGGTFPVNRKTVATGRLEPVR
jgi:hypothetical protein